MKKFRSVLLTVVEKELKVKDYGTERLGAILGGLFLASTRIFLGKAVYMVLRSSYLPGRKIIALGTSTVKTRE